RFAENYLYPGVREGLAALRKIGCRLAAVTSETRCELEYTLSFFDLVPFFAATVAVDEVAHRKPEPDSLLRGLELLRGTPETAVYLGDSPSDLRAARAAGVTSVAALWGGQPPEALLAEGPDAVFQTFAAFVGWVRGRVSSPGRAAFPAESRFVPPVLRS
ncbi:MAG TPA: HAD-IA family hydrolase, partial [Firmicutes bacterium]|nr:HAD-IA family hydrolase [Bacillota bacterium]